MLNLNTTAFVFPGQGSQQVGMGRELAEQSPAARVVFEQGDAILGAGFSALCWHGPEDDLNETYNTQPALYLASMAALAALREASGGELAPAMVAGHSLGEVTALAAAGALSFADGLRLVRERGRLMRLAGERSPGGMAAVLGLDVDVLAQICAQASDSAGAPVVVANDNCPGQTVISGDDVALERAMELAREAGSRRVVRLAVSIAAHSPLMESVAADYRAAVAAIEFQRPQVPVVANITARPLEDAAAIRAELSGQLTQPVRWTESITWMCEQGITDFVELGSGDVLAKLIRRIDRGAKRHVVGTPEAVAALLG